MCVIDDVLVVRVVHFGNFNIIGVSGVRRLGGSWLKNFFVLDDNVLLRGPSLSGTSNIVLVC
ncbi:hypothetical protein FA95DRAFT_1559282 [Auriscalpium vulgare]|uniref:Uncharacterized protein n=1 Tax=Auriscalpium vulgare TaxID=40419 RepID=A0ACB8RTI1_9AGAM|nr:hypothetical protein FA95DRAFT_1559282 [Auriscalpium vulgare]